MQGEESRGPAAGPALVGIAAVSALAAATRASRPLLSGPDPFWHWDLGRRIVRDGLPAADPYSFLTSGEGWILNQWGTEALVGLVDRVGGLWVLSVVTALLVGAIFAHVGWRMWRRSPSLLTVGLLGLVYMAALSNLTLRGNLLTYVFLPLLLHEALRRQGPRVRVVLPLMLLWANMHAAFLLGLAILVIHGAGEVVRAIPQKRRRLVARRGGLVLAATAVTAITPYGPRLLLQVLQLSRGGARSGVTEWGPPTLLSTTVLPFTVLVAIVLTAVAISATRENLPEILLVVAFTLFGLVATRNLAPAAIALGIVGAPYVGRGVRLLRGLPGTATERAPSPLDRTVAGFLLALGVVLVLALVPRTNMLAPHVEDTPLATIEDLDKTDRPARVYTTTSWAPAVAILTDAEVRTAVDGRLELFDAEERDAWRLVNRADPGWEEQLADWCVTDVIVPTDGPLAARLEEVGRWRNRATRRIHGADDRHATWFVNDAAPQTCAR